MRYLADMVRLAPPAWVLAPLARARSITLIAAEPGAGKSALALACGIAAASGIPLLGGAAPKEEQRVLFLGLDAPYYDYSYLATRISGGLGVQPMRLGELGQDHEPWPPFLFSSQGGDIRVPRYRASLLAGASGTGSPPEFLSRPPTLLIFDTLSCIHTADENLAQPMSEVMGALRALSQNAAIIITHHIAKVRKGDEVAPVYSSRGSTVIPSSVDMILLLRSKRTGPTTREVHGTWTKGRGPDLPEHLRYLMRWDAGTFAFEPLSDTADTVSARLKAGLEKGRNYRWSELVSLGRASADQVRKAADDLKLVRSDGLWRLP